MFHRAKENQPTKTGEVTYQFSHSEDIMRIIATLANAALFLVLSMTPSDAADCSRKCLAELADTYLSALVAHNPNKVPLDADVKIVENTRVITPGTGLWETATAGPTEFKIVIPDVVSQQVGGMVIMGSGDDPIQLGFRLKLAVGKIVEAEHLFVSIKGERIPESLRNVRPSIPMEIPYEYADSRGRLIHIAKSYYDAVDLNNGSLAHFADDCERHENGMRTAPSGGPLSGPDIPGVAKRPPGLLGMVTCKSQVDMQIFQYITDITHRRVVIADTKTGLAIGFSDFEHAMETNRHLLLNDPEREFADRDFEPFDTVAMHIFKIWGGEIHGIEALGLRLPYKTPSGWE